MGWSTATSGASGKEIQDLTSDDFDLANNLNLTGPFLMAREAAKYMEGAGSIVMYSSMFGLVSPNQANYPPWPYAKSNRVPGLEKRE